MNSVTEKLLFVIALFLPLYLMWQITFDVVRPGMVAGVWGDARIWWALTAMAWQGSLTFVGLKAWQRLPEKEP